MYNIFLSGGRAVDIWKERLTTEDRELKSKRKAAVSRIKLWYMPGYQFS
jgi:hypothetical protein